MESFLGESFKVEWVNEWNIFFYNTVPFRMTHLVDNFIPFLGIGNRKQWNSSKWKFTDCYNPSGAENLCGSICLLG